MLVFVYSNKHARVFDYHARVRVFDTCPTASVRSGPGGWGVHAWESFPSAEVPASHKIAAGRVVAVGTPAESFVKEKRSREG